MSSDKNQSDEPELWEPFSEPMAHPHSAHGFDQDPTNDDAVQPFSEPMATLPSVSTPRHNLDRNPEENHDNDNR
jgi:hypothetical protein